MRRRASSPSPSDMASAMAPWVLDTSRAATARSSSDDRFDLVEAHQSDQDEHHELERPVAGQGRDDGVEVVPPVGERGDG